MKSTFIALIVALCCVGSQADKFDDAYDRVNAYLVKNVPSNDPEANMDAIAKLKATEGKDDPYLYQLCGKLLPLKDLLSNGNCKLYPSKTVNGILHGEEALAEPKTRVDELVQHYVLEHAIQCLDQYRKIFNKNINTVDPNSWLKAEKFILSGIPATLNGKCGLALEKNEESIIGNFKVYEYLLKEAKGHEKYSALVSAKDTKKGKIIDRPGLWALLEDFIDEPCQVVNEEIAESLSGVTKYDLLALTAAGSDSECADFANDAAVINICKRLATNGHYFQNMRDQLEEDVRAKVL